MRLIAEQASIQVERRYRGSFEGATAETRFFRNESARFWAWGARGEFGAALPFGSGFAVVPRGGLSVLLGQKLEHRLEVVGIEHVWKVRPKWWSLSAGAELQMFARLIGVSLDLGVGWLTGETWGEAPAAFSVETEEHIGLLGRVAANLRLPVDLPFGVGLIAAAEGYTGPPLSGQTAGKLSFGLFLEWDAGKQ